MSSCYFINATVGNWVTIAIHCNCSFKVTTAILLPSEGANYKLFRATFYTQRKGFQWISPLKDFEARIVGSLTDNIMYSISVFSLTLFFDTEVVLAVRSLH